MVIDNALSVPHSTRCVLPRQRSLILFSFSSASVVCLRVTRGDTGAKSRALWRRRIVECQKRWVTCWQIDSANRKSLGAKKGRQLSGDDDACRRSDASAMQRRVSRLFGQSSGYYGVLTLLRFKSYYCCYQLSSNVGTDSAHLEHSFLASCSVLR